MTYQFRRSEEVKELYRKFGEEDAKQTVEDYRELLKIPAFRRVFAGILKRSRVFGSISYDSNDTNAVMKTVGFRELGVDIYLAANQADGQLVLTAISERNELERARRARVDALTEKKGN